MYEINDQTLISEIEGFCTDIVAKEAKNFTTQFEHPLDSDAIDMVTKLLSEGKDTIEYSQVGQLDAVWIALINKAIKCLRFLINESRFLIVRMKQKFLWLMGLRT